MWRMVAAFALERTWALRLAQSEPLLLPLEILAVKKMNLYHSYNRLLKSWHGRAVDRNSRTSGKGPNAHGIDAIKIIVILEMLCVK